MKTEILDCEKQPFTNGLYNTLKARTHGVTDVYMPLAVFNAFQGYTTREYVMEDPPPSSIDMIKWIDGDIIIHLENESTAPYMLAKSTNHQYKMINFTLSS